MDEGVFPVWWVWPDQLAELIMGVVPSSNGLVIDFDRALEGVMGIEVPAMNGDNLAVSLCTYFDEGEGEEGDSGWSPSATEGYEQVKKALKEHFAPFIEQLESFTLTHGQGALYVQFADVPVAEALSIRRWSREPFDGAEVYVSNEGRARADAALEQASVWFEEYAELHSAKGTPEAKEKAERNLWRAQWLRAQAPILQGGEE